MEKSPLVSVGENNTCQESHQPTPGSALSKTADSAKMSLAIHEFSEPEVTVTETSSAQDPSVTKMAGSASSLLPSVNAHIRAQQADPKINADQTLIHPVVLGNISGANLLAAAIRSKQEQLQAPLYLNHQLGGQLMNVMPLFIQQPENSPHMTKTWPVSTATVLMSSACLPSQFQDMGKQRVHEPQYKPSDELTASGSFTKHDSELCFRAPLSSSDTIILSTSLSSSNTVPTSSLTLLSNDSLLGKILKQDLSLVSSSGKPFSLLPGISDRSVSLESIPSLDLLQPDEENVSNLSLLKPDATDAVGVAADAGHVTSGLTVVDLTRNAASDLCAQTGKDEEAEGNSDTDTEMQGEEVPPNKPKESNLIRSDTVILNNEDQRTRSDTLILIVSKDQSPVCPEPGLQSSGTVFLTREEEEVHSGEKLPNSFGLMSANLSNSSPSEIHINESLGYKTDIVSHSLVNQPSTPHITSLLQNELINKSLYIMTNDGQLTAFRYIPSDPLDITQPSQLRVITRRTDGFPPFMYESCSDVAERTVEAKETQTELAGTNTVFFRSLDQAHGENIYSFDHLGSTAFTESSPTQPSSVTSAAVINNSAVQSGHNLLPAEKFQGSDALPGEAVTYENIGSCNLPSLPQGVECSITPLQTSEPGLPNTSCASDSCPFQCMECHEKYETKQELVTHEKLHKKGFKCDLCNATFTRVGNFTRHRKIHNLQPEVGTLP